MRWERVDPRYHRNTQQIWQKSKKHTAVRRDAAGSEEQKPIKTSTEGKRLDGETLCLLRVVIKHWLSCCLGKLSESHFYCNNKQIKEEISAC